MNTYVIIPMIALIGYALFLTVFMVAKKTRLVTAFIYVLISMFAWTGGSFAMRQMLWPSYNFWFHISLTGMLFVPVGFLVFLEEYLGVHQSNRKVLIVITTIMAIFNVTTEILIESPKLMKSISGEIRLVHNLGLSSVMLFLFCIGVIAWILYLCYENWKKNEHVMKQIWPILFGLGVLLVGQLCLFLPVFKGFPVDVLSGVINILFLFYALYAKRIFKPTLLISKGNACVITMGLIMIAYYYGSSMIKDLMRDKISSQYAELLTVFIILVTAAGAYWVIREFFDRVFNKNDMRQTKNLKMFTVTAAKSMNVREILLALVQAVTNALQVEEVYVCLENEEGQYAPLRPEKKIILESWNIKKDHPLLTYLKEHDHALMLEDIPKDIFTEDEKKLLKDNRIESILPLGENALIGFVLLMNKKSHRPYNYNDFEFLASIKSVAAMAIRNSRMYETAYEEARRDSLTGIYNRRSFYEILNDYYEKRGDETIALIMLDIDDFKLYGKLYGNKEGDIALTKIANYLSEKVGVKGIVARYAGKRFAVLLPKVEVKEGKNLSKEWCDGIRNLFEKKAGGETRVLTVSVGLCVMPKDASTVTELVDNADMAVYYAKEAGKNRVRVFAKGAEEIQETDESAYKEYATTIYALTATIDSKDHYTFNHSQNVAYYAGKLAKLYGLDKQSIEITKEAALLHDIGKIGIPERILNKPDRLTEEEFEIMKGHVENAKGIIRFLPSLDYVTPAVLGHHERYDGGGYPRKLKGNEIPLMARILCVADSFDAMMSKRSYKTEYPIENTLNILRGEAGKQFDPELVEVFVQGIEKGLINWKRYNEEEKELWPSDETPQEA